MSNDTPKFCFICGKKLVSMYPGNDPENGPRRMQCPTDEHPTVGDVRMQVMWDLSAAKAINHAIYQLTEPLSYVHAPALDVKVAEFVKQLRQGADIAEKLEKQIDRAIDSSEA